MILTIHNLPNNIQYKDIKDLLQSKCGLSQVILDKLVKSGNGRSVMVGVASDADAANLRRNINGMFFNGQQLYVEGVGQSKEPEKPYNTAPQASRWSQSNQPNQGFSTPQFNQNYPQNMASAANLYGQQGTQSVQNQYMPYGGQNQTRPPPPPPVPNPYAQMGQYNAPQQYNQPRQQTSAPWANNENSYSSSYSDGGPPAKRNPPQETSYRGGPWGRNGNSGGPPSRNYQDDHKERHDAGGYDRNSRENPNRSSGQHSPWENPSAQAGRSDFSQHGGRDNSRNWKDSPQSFQQKSVPGRNEPDKRPWNEPFQGSQRDNSGPSAQYPPRSNPPQNLDSRAFPVNKNDNPKKRPWEQANQYQGNQGHERGGPSTSQHRPSMRPDSKSFQNFEFGNQPMRNEGGPSSSQRPGLGPRDNEPSFKIPKKSCPIGWNKFNFEGRAFNKCLSDGVVHILLDNYKMLRDSTDPPVSTTIKPIIRDLYKRNITDRAYKLLEGRHDLSKKQVKMLYRSRYSEEDDVQLYKEVVRNIQSVKSAEDLDGIMQSESDIDNMTDFTKRRRRKEKKRQHRMANEILQMSGNQPLPKLKQKQKHKSTPELQLGYFNKPPAFMQQKVKHVQKKPIIPPHPNNDLKLKKQQKRETKEEMKTLEPYSMPPVINKAVDDEIEQLAVLLDKQFDDAGDNIMRQVIFNNINSSALIDHCKRFFKHHLSKRITNQGVVLLRVYGRPMKMLKRDMVEKFLNNKGCISLSKSKRGPFFIATFNRYDDADKCVAMNNITLGRPGQECSAEFRHMYVLQKPKLRFGVVNEARKRLKRSLVDRSNIDLLAKNWPEMEEALKKKKTPKKGNVKNSVATAEKIKNESANSTADTDVKIDSSTADTNVKIDSSTADTNVKIDNSTADTNVKIDSSTADTNVKNDSSTADTNVKIDSSTADTNVKIDSSTADTNVKNESSDTNKNDNKNIKNVNTENTADVTNTANNADKNVKPKEMFSEEFWSDDFKVMDEVKGSEDDLPQQSLHTHNHEDDDWDGMGEDWDDNDNTGMSKDAIDLDDVDENDLEDY